ncbi:hypothetical protein D3C71_2155870 [compost metagenome]
MTVVDHNAERFGLQRLKVITLLLGLIGKAGNGEIELFLFEHLHEVVTGLLHHLDRQ